MRAGNQEKQHTNKRQATYSRDQYVQGTAVKKLNVKEAIQEEPKKKLSHAVRKNREKAKHMSFGYVTFLVMALSVTGIILVKYIGLQFEVTNKVKNISNMESELMNLKLKNDEELNRIESSVDLEEIKRIAIQELGMTYAKDGQVITFSAEGSDYVRQVANIPE